MAGYQFIHYEAYARNGNEKKRSLISIAEEADRAPGSHPHVINPLPPETLLGSSFVDAARQIVAAADESRVNHGGKKRKLRKDANVGIGLIASHPTSLNDIHALPEPDRQRMIDDVRDWAEDVIIFAQNEFPRQVRVAALHWDETHPHIHILIGSTDPTEDFEVIHKGEQARRRAQGNDRSAQGKKAGNDAYTREMRRFQDRYHAEVSLHHGQARLGPGRRRLTRSEWRKEQAQAESLAHSKRLADEVQSRIENDLADAAMQAQVIVDASQEEARHQRKKAERERVQAEQERQQAEALKQQAAEEARQAAELKAQAQQIKSVLDERVKELSKYDGMFGRVLGWLGIRQRIERNAEAKFQQQIAGLKKQVDSLRARIDRDDAVKKQHDHAVGALNALQRALSVVSDPNVDLSSKGAIEGYLRYIHGLLHEEQVPERLEQRLETLVDELKSAPLREETVQSRYSDQKPFKKY
jgi:flagellar biosynthesis GTPase FlhF